MSSGLLFLSVFWHTQHVPTGGFRLLASTWALKSGAYVLLSRLWAERFVHLPRSDVDPRTNCKVAANKTWLNDHPSRLLQGLKIQIHNWCILPFMWPHSESVESLHLKALVRFVNGTWDRHLKASSSPLGQYTFISTLADSPHGRGTFLLYQQFPIQLGADINPIFLGIDSKALQPNNSSN